MLARFGLQTFKTKAFARFAAREGLEGAALCEAALAFFVYGFAKSGRENLRRDELETFRLLAGEYLALDGNGLAAAQAAGAIVEVKCDDQAVQE